MSREALPEVKNDEVQTLLNRWQELMEIHMITKDCCIEVSRKDHWFIISGFVDSFGTKGRLFTLVPEINGARYIVDRVRIGQPHPTPSQLFYEGESTTSHE